MRSYAVYMFPPTIFILVIYSSSTPGTLLGQTYLFEKELVSLLCTCHAHTDKITIGCGNQVLVWDINERITWEENSIPHHELRQFFYSSVES